MGYFFILIFHALLPRVLKSLYLNRHRSFMSTNIFKTHQPFGTSTKTKVLQFTPKGSARIFSSDSLQDRTLSSLHQISEDCSDDCCCCCCCCLPSSLLILRDALAKRSLRLDFREIGGSSLFDRITRFRRLMDLKKEKRLIIHLWLSHDF